MIPKIIHCCWFGGSPKTDLAQRCIASWKRYCPDYEIREWNERNFDLDLNGYCRQAYDSQKWAFVNDVARIWALHRFGGIYMDTDVEVRRPLDPLLENEAFAGFESAEYVGTCLLGATAGHPLFREMLRRYASLSFLGEDGTPDLTTNVVRLTCLLTEKYGLLLPAETAAGKEGGGVALTSLRVYPQEYFSPFDFERRLIRPTRRTYAIHWFSGSWIETSAPPARMARPIWRETLSRWNRALKRRLKTLK